MSCKRFQRMLHLNRPGELSENEAEELSQHLKTCPECSEEFRRIQAADRILDLLRAQVPVLAQPDDLVEDVLSGIGRSPAEAVRRFNDGLPGWLIDLLLSPAVRFGTAGLAVFAVGLFMIQEVALLVSVNALEEKIGGRSSRPSGPGIEYSISAPTAGWNADVHRLQKLAMPEWEGRQNGSVVVSQRTIEQFVSGMGPAPIEMLRLASTLGSEPRHVRSLVRYLEQHATAKVVF
jgi:hypothetical protein